MRIMIVDDHVGMRALIRLLVTTAGDVVFECASGAEAMRAARTFQPDCVTMDIRLPDFNGLVITRSLRAMLPAVRVVIVTSLDYPDLQQAATEAGACGYVVKENLLKLRSAILTSETPPAPAATDDRRATGPNSEGDVIRNDRW
jgi:DNA-binding NarL/FixJ family response regulator